tara:strand:- start:451 stop:735 length:285 start_codon:yes stop_codon:yes gene_type:complete
MKNNDEEEEIISLIYELLLSKKYHKRKYLKFLMWKKFIFFHYPHLLRTDYFLRKIFDNMIDKKLFISKRFKNRTLYRLNDFRIEEEKDIGYVFF